MCSLYLYACIHTAFVKLEAIVLIYAYAMLCHIYLIWSTVGIHINTKSKSNVFLNKLLQNNLTSCLVSLSC